jgi:hypothetical protein
VVTTTNRFGVNLLGHAFISGGLYIGSSSPVTTAGRLQITENLYTGGAIHADGIICSYGSGSGKAGTTGGIEIEWDGSQSDILSYNRNTSTYQVLRLRGNDIRLCYSSTTVLRVTGSLITLTGDAAFSGGLYLGSSSPVTTAGRLKMTNSLYLGGGIVLGYVNGTVDDDAIRFYQGSTLVGEIRTQDTTWFRINQDTGKNTYTPQYLYGAAGLRAGSPAAAPAGGDVTYADALIKDQGGTDRGGAIYVPLTIMIHAVNYWATAKSGATGNYRTVSTEWPGVPANVKAIVLRIHARDSAAHPQTGLYLQVGPANAIDQYDHLAVHPGGNNVHSVAQGIVKVTSNTVYVRYQASGSLTLDTWLGCVGYFI